MDPEKIKAISRLVATCFNENRPKDAAPELAAFFGPGMSGSEKLVALAATPIYALVAARPGYNDDGQPGYLPVDADLKAAVLNELNAMAEADFDSEEHRQTWMELKKSVENTPESDFLPGVAVNCPDDYLLTLDKLFVSDVLRKAGILPPDGDFARVAAES